MKKQGFLGYLIAIYVIFTALILFLFTVAFQLLPEKGVYDFLKDHGSLIAGIIGFGGVIWLILAQKEETKKILSSNLGVMRNEAFEIARRDALNCVVSVKSDIHALIRFAMINKKLDCSLASEQKIYRILKNAYQLNIFLGEDLNKQKSLVSLIVEYTNLYMAVCMGSNANMQDLPSIVAARMYGIGLHLNALNIPVYVDDLRYDSLQYFYSDYNQVNNIEGAITITKYLQLYLDATVIPEVVQRIRKKSL